MTFFDLTTLVFLYLLFPCGCPQPHQRWRLRLSFLGMEIVFILHHPKRWDYQGLFFSGVCYKIPIAVKQGHAITIIHLQTHKLDVEIMYLRLL